LFDEKAGEGVTIFVVDTGVFADHEDFEGRATNGFNAIDGEEDVDLNGHGTHCSATAAGKTFGVAKKAQVVGVKVLDAQGAGDNAGVIKGIEFAVAEHTKKVGKAGFKGSVISMSLGGGKSAVVDQAVDKVIVVNY
jgi:cerevisin